MLCYACLERLLTSVSFFSSRRRHTRYWRDWSSDVCSSDLSGLRRLTRTADGVWDDNPEYSPDGRTIVFSSNRGGADRDLHTMRADGGRVRELTGEVGVDEWFPAWTPDGRQVVYWSLALDGSARDTAWIVDHDGTDPRPLTS